MDLSINSELIATNDATQAAAFGGGFASSGQTDTVRGCNGSALIQDRGKGVDSGSVTVQHLDLVTPLDAERKILETLAAGRKSGPLELASADGSDDLTYSKAVATPGEIRWRGAFCSVRWDVVAGGVKSRS